MIIIVFCAVNLSQLDIASESSFKLVKCESRFELKTEGSNIPSLFINANVILLVCPCMKNLYRLAAVISSTRVNCMYDTKLLLRLLLLILLLLLLLLQPLYGSLDFVWDYPGEPVPER